MVGRSPSQVQYREQTIEQDGDVVTPDPPWSIRAALISVSDLDRSSTFYQDIMDVREVYRQYQIAVLGTDVAGPFTIFLREAEGNPVHAGQHSIGLRALWCDVGSSSELDRVEARLRALGAFRDRRSIDKAAQFEVVYGKDPDRLALTFTANGTGRRPPFEEDAGRAAVFSVAV